MPTIVRNPGPITTCLAADNPGDTRNRHALFAIGPEKIIIGWITRLPWWGEDKWHVSACKDGVVHLVAYVQDPAQIIPVLQNWWTDVQNAEKARAADEDGV
jgi:hypothetical protein